MSLINKLESEVNAINMALNAPFDISNGVQTKYGLLLGSGKAPCDMAVIVRAHTGTCGESWTEEFFLDAGADIDAFCEEIAKENAATYGNDGGYTCPDCGHSSDSEECPDCGTQCEWSENTDIAGQVYKYQPDVSCSSVNGGSPIATVINWAIEQGHISITPDNKALIYLNALKGFIHLPTQTDINYLVEEMAAIHNLTTVEYA